MFRMKKRTQLNLTSLTNKYNVGAVFLLFVIQQTRVDRENERLTNVRDNRLEAAAKKKNHRQTHTHKQTHAYTRKNISTNACRYLFNLIVLLSRRSYCFRSFGFPSFHD